MTSLSRAEEIKWWDALDVLTESDDVERGLRMARECQHPDARWLVSLFPLGVSVTHAHVAKVLKQQGEDPRALYVLSSVKGCDDGLRRAAEMGYGPAQASLSSCRWDEEAVSWAQKATANGAG
jgi:hypothetical protein